MQLSKNFTKKEAIEWANTQSMSDKDKKYCIKLSTENWNDDVENKAKLIANELQLIRDKINSEFPQYNGKIGLKILSWFRAKEWELHRKRSGKSEHTKGWAVDFIVTNIPDNYIPVIMDWLWIYLHNWNGGLARFYKNKKWTFIHIDLGKKRRWEY